MLYFSDFVGGGEVHPEPTALNIAEGVLVSYAVSLCVSAILLSFFGHFDSMTPVFCLCQTVVLGLPASLGAAAGKLLLQ